VSYIERERQRAEVLQQEQLDWLHAHHLELAEQTRLLREIAKYTGLQHRLTVIALGLLGIAAVVALCAAVIAGGPGIRAIGIVMGIGAGALVAAALIDKRTEDER